ncbi:MAG: hypothetical protein ACYDCI_13495 [Candidatus Limnocylindrales bacterium]
MTSVGLDRLAFRAHILETGSSSYRLRTSQAKRREKGPPAAGSTTRSKVREIGRGWGQF